MLTAVWHSCSWLEGKGGCFYKRASPQTATINTVLPTMPFSCWAGLIKDVWQLPCLEIKEACSGGCQGVIAGNDLEVRIKDAGAQAAEFNAAGRST